jgi:hypothetical protein
MIVQYQGRKPPQHFEPLTLGGNYIVIDKDVATYQLVDDRGEVCDYPRSEFAIIDDRPYRRRSSGGVVPPFRENYQRFLTTIHARRPDLEVRSRPGVVVPLETLGTQTARIGFGSNGPDAVRAAAAAYRRVLLLGSSIEPAIDALVDGGHGAARVYAVCALSEITNPSESLSRLAGDHTSIVFHHPTSPTVTPLTVEECAHRLHRVGPALWDLRGTS